MARKKAEHLSEINQRRIAEVAKELFMKYGVEETKIDDVAKKAGMSKSTLYVYFRSKEDIKNYISLEAMKYLQANVQSLLSHQQLDKKDLFLEICYFFVLFQEKYPMNFQLLIGEICVDKEIMNRAPFLLEIYEMGEKVNQMFFSLIRMLYDKRSNSTDKELQGMILMLWGSIYGIITIANNKQKYIEMIMNTSKEQYLNDSFIKLYEVLGGDES